MLDVFGFPLKSWWQKCEVGFAGLEIGGSDELESHWVGNSREWVLLAPICLLCSANLQIQRARVVVSACS